MTEFLQSFNLSVKRWILAFVVLTSAAILLLHEIRRKELPVPDYWWFSALIGLAADLRP